MKNNNSIQTSSQNDKLTIQPNETYRYKFGQWLVFLKTGISNQLGITNINQSVAFMPILAHDKASYSLSLPATINNTVQGEYGTYSEHYYIGKMIGKYIKDNAFLLCLLAMQLIFIMFIFTTKF